MIATSLRDSQMSSAQGKLPELMRVYIQHPALEREDVCHQVGFCFEAPRCGLHSAVGACRVERFAFPVFVDFRFCLCVIRRVLLSVLSPVLELLPMPP